jgi:hypothetical protein
MPEYTGPYNPDPKPGEAGIVIYGYVPSLVLAVTAVVLFGLLLLAHVFLFFKYKTTRTFQFLLAFGCAMEIVGYGMRVASHGRPFVVMFFVLNYFMIVCVRAHYISSHSYTHILIDHTPQAPVFFSAAIYLALAALIRLAPRPKAIIPLSPRALVTIFIILDVITIATQVAGAGLIGASESASANRRSFAVSPAQANHILLAGLAVQSASFLVFMAILAKYLASTRRSDKTEKTDMTNETARHVTGHVTGHVTKLTRAVLFWSALLIFLRTLFRLSETAQGVFGSLSINEDYFLGLEFVPVVVALALWVLRPLGREFSEPRYRG